MIGKIFTKKDCLRYDERHGLPAILELPLPNTAHFQCIKPDGSASIHSLVCSVRVSRSGSPLPAGTILNLYCHSLEGLVTASFPLE